MRTPKGRVQNRFNLIREEKRGPMNSKFKTVATAILAVGLAASFANASDKDPAAKPKKHATAAEGKKPTCDACDQIQALKTEMQGQIDAMKQEIASKDAALAAA
jgi:hypothetical protein